VIRGLESRISRLEQYRKPQRCYVINCSDPPTADELSKISRAKVEGRRVALVPRVCATVEEWIAKHAPKANEHA
jgi:hypothetical protein